MLAMCCDFRIITSNATMGLNEVAIGLTVPPVWAQVMSTIIGQKEAERMCCYAKIADAVEAKKLGLVDHVVDSNSDSDLMDAAIYIISPAIMVPDQAKAMVKLFFRKSMADVLGDQNRINKEAEVNWPVLASPLVVKALDKVFARLSKSKL